VEGAGDVRLDAGGGGGEDFVGFVVDEEELDGLDL
jgi:hypothetical protein